jgi:cephalosporin hydroxylase
MSEIKRFQDEVSENVRRMGNDRDLLGLSRIWMREAARYRYAYNYTWMGRPIIQLPTDMMAMQEIIWKTKPDLIVETGVAHGGSLIFYASLLELIGGEGRVIGVDIDIRAHNRAEIDAHPMRKRIELIQGSSIDPAIADQVAEHAAKAQRVMVLLDSNHTHDHVLEELKLYSALVTNDCYLVVFDTAIEDLPEDLIIDRPWGPGNSPKTAVHEFLKTDARFEIDRELENKLLMTVAPDGWLRRVGS